MRISIHTWLEAAKIARRASKGDERTQTHSLLLRKGRGLRTAPLAECLMVTAGIKMRLPIFAFAMVLGCGPNAARPNTALGTESVAKRRDRSYPESRYARPWTSS